MPPVPSQTPSLTLLTCALSSATSKGHRSEESAAEEHAGTHVTEWSWDSTELKTSASHSKNQQDLLRRCCRTLQPHHLQIADSSAAGTVIHRGEDRFLPPGKTLESL